VGWDLFSQIAVTGFHSFMSDCHLGCPLAFVLHLVTQHKFWVSPFGHGVVLSVIAVNADKQGYQQSCDAALVGADRSKDIVVLRLLNLQVQSAIAPTQPIHV